MPDQLEIVTVSLPMNVQDAMRENLPEQVGKLLRGELEKGAKAIQERERYLTDLKKAEALLDEYGDIKAERRAMKKEREALEEQEREITRKSDTLELQRAQLELQAANRYADRLEGTLAGLVRNIEWRDSIFKQHGQEFGPVDGPAVVERSVDSTKTAT